MDFEAFFKRAAKVESLSEDEKTTTFYSTALYFALIPTTPTLLHYGFDALKLLLIYRSSCVYKGYKLGADGLIRYSTNTNLTSMNASFWFDRIYFVEVFYK